MWDLENLHYHLLNLWTAIAYDSGLARLSNKQVTKTVVFLHLNYLCTYHRISNRDGKSCLFHLLQVKLKLKLEQRMEILSPKCNMKSIPQLRMPMKSIYLNAR